MSRILLYVLIGSTLFACSPKNEPAVVQDTPAMEILPSPTTAPDRVVVITGDVQDSWTLEKANSTVQELATASGLEFESQISINSREITPDIKVLVYLYHPNNLGSLANSAPNTQFIVISDQEWTPSHNVSIIRADSTYQTFMAGYASVMLAENFRGGGLLTSEDSAKNVAYKNGAKFFCGSCSALISPLNSYPFTKEIPQSSPAADWITAFDEVNFNTILYMYIPPQAYSTELFNHIAQTNVKILGIATPPAEAFPIWAGTFLIDGFTPIKEIWDAVLQGNGGQTINASLSLADTQSGFISTGKQQIIQDVIAELQAGRIYTLNPMAE
ncbi:MAG TPA: hypothetical protein DCK95_01210 [Anaerolineaceae bacterium]|nr:hypothetical protein [Anaerolineaceae bacterium]